VELFPAIDLLAGQAVRLHQGNYDRVTVYDRDPPSVARRFATGARWLHVVDLEGARAGRPMARDTVRAVIEAFRATREDGAVQVGGGVRSIEAAEEYLQLGAARVVLGTAAADAPELVRTLAERHPGCVVVALDARDGLVATHGWERTSKRTAVELAEELRGLPIAALLYTDVARDGTRQGPNLEATARLAAVGLPVLASGGVGSLEDVRALARVEGVVGAIVGRAIYEGSFTLEEAVGAAGGG
jgi:phosphoribosylformimino-5-aminoimidazole carboxamide ribotide isomerase